MTDPTDVLKERLRRLTLLLGVAQVTVGCLLGFVPPTGVAWFRGIVMAHIEYTGNGILLIALGLLVREMRLSATAWWVWFAALQLGTWLNGASGVLAALLGSSSRLLSLANASSPPPAGAANGVVTGMLITTGVTMVVGLLITLIGLARSRPARAG